MATPGKPLPWETRERIIKLHGQGFSLRRIAEILKISKRTVGKYLPKNSLCKCSP